MDYQTLEQEYKEICGQIDSLWLALDEQGLHYESDPLKRLAISEQIDELAFRATEMYRKLGETYNLILPPY